MEISFEVITIHVQKGKGCYLKTDLGDYMKLLLEENRNGGHPMAAVCFNKPYKAYQEEGK